MPSFVKLYSTLLHSTIWQEDRATKLLWITMLALADSVGRVWASVPGLAHAAGVMVEECQIGLGKFMSPDPHSRTKEHEGRRVAEIDGGWQLLNYAK